MFAYEDAPTLLKNNTLKRKTALILQYARGPNCQKMGKLQKKTWGLV